jgi:hypothetical protein
MVRLRFQDQQHLKIAATQRRQLLSCGRLISHNINHLAI